MSILSFARLGEKYGDDYIGGILLIDEIDSTLHGFSQRKLIEFLSKMAYVYKIQIVFTTHSPTVLRSINSLQRDELKRNKIADISLYDFENQIVHLTPQYSDEGKRFIVGENIVSVNRLHVALNDMEMKSTYLNQHIHLYTEDNRSFSLLSRILSYNSIDLNSYVDYIDIDQSWTNYCQLLNKGIPEFLNSMIVLDKDVSEMYKNPNQEKAVSKSNVIYMPIDVEKGLFAFLKNHKNYNGFSDILKQHDCDMSYDICFSDWPDEDYETKEYKAWFKHLEESIPDINILFDYWCCVNTDLVSEFCSEFKEGYNSIAKDMGLDYIF